MPDENLDIRGYLIPVVVLEAELKQNGYRLLSERQLSLLTVEGYVKTYYENTTTTTTYAEAWRKTEAEYQAAFGVERFVTYDSFRNSSQVMRYLNTKK